MAQRGWVGINSCHGVLGRKLLSADHSPSTSGPDKRPLALVPHFLAKRWHTEATHNPGKRLSAQGTHWAVPEPPRQGLAELGREAGAREVH